MKQFEIKREYGGESEMSWIQNVCSCGWKGIKRYAYEDYQHTLLREEASQHTRDKHNATR